MKQNWKIFFCWLSIDVFLRYSFSPVCWQVPFSWWRHHLLDDVTNLKFFLWVRVMVGNLCTEFGVKRTSRSKVIKGGVKNPPLVIQNSKKPGINRVKRWNREKAKIKLISIKLYQKFRNWLHIALLVAFNMTSSNAHQLIQTTLIEQFDNRTYWT